MKTKTIEIGGERFTFARPFLAYVREFEELMRDLAARRPVSEEEAERITLALVLSALGRVTPTTRADLERRIDVEGLQQLVGEVSSFSGLERAAPGEAPGP